MNTPKEYMLCFQGKYSITKLIDENGIHFRLYTDIPNNIPHLLDSSDSFDAMVKLMEYKALNNK